MTETAWKDGIDNSKLWTYSGPKFQRKSHRNEKLWAEIAAARRLLIAKAIAWREAAIADGWQCRPTYDHEPMEQAFRMTKDGFIVLGLARPETHEACGSGEISAWGPDGMHIPAGETYDWPALKRAVETCQYCGAFPCKTERVAFAGRACEECGPKQRAALPRNWAD